MKVILAQPRGFCAGVVRAIDVVERRSAFTVRRSMCVMRSCITNMSSKGSRPRARVFVEELDEVAIDAAGDLFRAWRAEIDSEEAERAIVLAIDATCPLVTKVHREAQALSSSTAAGAHSDRPCRPPGSRSARWARCRPVHRWSRPVEDVAALTIPADTPVAYVTQTTLSVDDTRGHYCGAAATVLPISSGPDIRDICYATQNRQSAVRDLSTLVDVILVVGANNSSNSNRLREIGEEAGTPSYLIADGNEVEPAWVRGATTVGITAGASAPEVLVEDVIDALRRRAGRGE